MQAAPAGKKSKGLMWPLFKLLPFFLLAMMRAFSCNDHDVVVHPASEPLGGAQTMSHAEVLSLSEDTWGVLVRPLQAHAPGSATGGL